MDVNHSFTPNMQKMYVKEKKEGGKRALKKHRPQNMGKKKEARFKKKKNGRRVCRVIKKKTTGAFEGRFWHFPFYLAYTSLFYNIVCMDSLA